MESINYNAFFDSASNPQPYQYVDFAADAPLLSHGPSADDHPRLHSLDAAVASNAFAHGSFAYPQFHDTALHAANMASLREDSTSSPAQPLSAAEQQSRDLHDAENDQRGRRSSSEDNGNPTLTPAQSRRKAQNRAAQRAFRERKERHVRDLEAKLNLLTTTTSSLQSDNERLKLMLRRAQTENDILRARAASPSASNYHHLGLADHPSTRPTSRSPPASRQPTSPSFHNERPVSDTARLTPGLLSTSTSARVLPHASPPSFGSPTSGEGHYISASAAWDLLQSHPLYLAGAVDIGEVCERLKKLPRCESGGPMFEEDEVRRIVEEVGRSGHDELI